MACRPAPFRLPALKCQPLEAEVILITVKPGGSAVDCPDGTRDTCRSLTQIGWT